MTGKAELKVNFDAMRRIVDLAVRRAVTFMGIGVNAGLAEPPISHLLQGGMQFKVVPDELTESQHQDVAREFTSWIIANAFRELAESFSVFLVEIFKAAYVLQNEPVSHATWSKAVSRFSREGVGKQLSVVSIMLGIEETFTPTFVALNQARNCLAHRRGVVGLPDATEGGKFVMRWRAFAVTLEDGRDLSLALRDTAPIIIEKDQSISMGMTDREKAFVVGEGIRLDRHDLAEIAMAVHFGCEHVIKGMVDRARELGKMPPSDPAKTEG
ncbi:MAG: hypothetical protein JNK47_02805 [Mesorhizobium sp.]|nr:hypothetical protein [Mesorhizobium sp.]